MSPAGKWKLKVLKQVILENGLVNLDHIFNQSNIFKKMKKRKIQFYPSSMRIISTLIWLFIAEWIMEKEIWLKIFLITETIRQ